jgi:hypothetical protein
MPLCRQTYLDAAHDDDIGHPQHAPHRPERETDPKRCITPRTSHQQLPVPGLYLPQTLRHVSPLHPHRSRHPMRERRRPWKHRTTSARHTQVFTRTQSVAENTGAPDVSRSRAAFAERVVQPWQSPVLCPTCSYRGGLGDKRRIRIGLQVHKCHADVLSTRCFGCTRSRSPWFHRPGARSQDRRKAPQVQRRQSRETPRAQRVPGPTAAPGCC